MSYESETFRVACMTSKEELLEEAELQLKDIEEYIKTIRTAFQDHDKLIANVELCEKLRTNSFRLLWAFSCLRRETFKPPPRSILVVPSQRLTVDDI